MTDAAGLGVTFWGPPPSPGQWAVAASELAAERVATGGGARFWLEWGGYATVLVGGPVTDHPQLTDRADLRYANGVTTASLVLVSVPRAYPEGPDGVGRGNTLLHERGHALNRVVYRRNDAHGSRKMSDLPEWYAAAGRLPWWTRSGNPDWLDERWADGYAAWVGSRAGLAGQAPPDRWEASTYHPVRAYFDRLARECGWPTGRAD